MGTIISIQAHCSDSFAMRAKDEEGKHLLDYNGYVPEFLGGFDDVELEIDVDTGRILNWDSVRATTELHDLKDAEDNGR